MTYKTKKISFKFNDYNLISYSYNVSVTVFTFLVNKIKIVYCNGEEKSNKIT